MRNQERDLPHDEVAAQFAMRCFTAGVRSGTVLLSCSLLLLFALLALISPQPEQTSLAAGSGGQGRFGWEGDGEGYGGTNRGGGGGTGSGPVPAAVLTTKELKADASSTGPEGENAAVEHGTSFAELNRKRGDVDFSLSDVPDAEPASGEAASDTGAGSGKEGTEFFGVRSTGRQFVYVVDYSSSMSGPPAQRAMQEVLDSIAKLRSTQKFYVIFFNHEPLCQFGDPGPPKNLLSASKANKQKLAQWVNALGSGGGTDPEQALLWAIDLKPSAIYFLTDGGFDPGIVDRVTQANSRRRVTINTIAFVNNSGESLLKDIAARNHGKYLFQP